MRHVGAKMQIQTVNIAEINPAVIMRGKNSNPGKGRSGGKKSSGYTGTGKKEKPKKGKK